MMDVSDDDQAGDSGGGIESVEHMAKALVRYALSCEHSRRPIKRQDINEKGLPLHCPPALVDIATAQANSCSPWLSHSSVQTSLCAGQQPAHGCLWNAAGRVAQG